MSILYDRKENDSQVVICFSKAAWFYVTLWPLLVAMGVLITLSWLNCWFALPAVAIIVWVLIWAVSFIKPVSEIKRAMRKGPVTSSGSKYSLADPRTYYISKNSD